MEQKNKKPQTKNNTPPNKIYAIISMALFAINYVIFNIFNYITITYTDSTLSPETIMITSSAITAIILSICFYSQTKRGYFKTLILLYLLHSTINFSYIGINYIYRSQSIYRTECIVEEQVNTGGRFNTQYTVLKFSDGKKWKTEDEDIYQKSNIGDRITLVLQDGYYNLPIVIAFQK